jgi:PAS domain S-box-containing protein
MGVMTNAPQDGLPPGLDEGGAPAQPHDDQAVERRARAMLAALVDGFVVVDGDGRITDVNQSLCDMTGFAEVELVGARAPFPFWPEEHRDERTAAFNATLASGAKIRHETVFCRKDGERFAATIDCSALGEGERGFVAVIRDISEQVRERDWLREAHDVARLASWEWDPERDRVRVWSGLRDIHGLQARDDLTMADALALVPAGDAHRLQGAVALLLSGEQTEVVLRHRAELAAGSTVWLETTLRSVRDANGGVLRVRGTSKDVTASKQIEDARELSERRLREAQRIGNMGSFAVDYRTGTLNPSPELCRLTGRRPTSLSDLATARLMLHAEDRDTVRLTCLETVADGKPRRLECRYMRGEEVRWAECRIEALGDEGDRYGVHGTLQDITERKRAQHEIDLHARLLDVVDVAVIATDLEGLVTHWNGGAERIYGWTRDEVIGQPIQTLTVGPGDRQLADTIMSSVRDKGEWEGEFDVRRKDGSSFPAFVRNALFTHRDGHVAGIVGVSVDISERVESERQLRSARNYLRAITENMGEGLYTLDTEGRLTYMNRAAEEMLGWHLSELIGKQMHDTTHSRRPDGRPLPAEECPILLDSPSGEAVRLRDEVFVRRDGSELPVDVTAAAFETEDGVRGRVVVFTDVSEQKAQEQRLRRQVERLSWVGRVRDALAEDRLELHAQPIVDLATRRTVQHELLVRLRDRDGTLVLPGEFLPAAEEHGLILDIDRWVVSRAAELAGQGNAIELNLSGRSIGAESFIAHLQAELERNAADPGLIVVELTETALLADDRASDLFVDRLRRIGCQLALDDFGTGYGGFSYLKRLPVDFLKIDREFVRDLSSNEASLHVVRAIVSLARGFGQRTVAEGVEDDTTTVLLRELGVDLVQGFAMGKPRPVAEVFGRRAAAAA